MILVNTASLHPRRAVETVKIAGGWAVSTRPHWMAHEPLRLSRQGGRGRLVFHVLSWWMLAFVLARELGLDFTGKC